MLAAVILNYNDAQNCLNVAHKAIDCGIDKAIIVDNKSPDQSGELLQAEQSDKIIVLLAEKNGGYAQGYNVGIRYAIENFPIDYLFVINSDVVFEKDVIQICIECLEKEPTYALVSTEMLDRNGNKDNSCWMYPTYNELLKKCFKIFKNNGNNYYEQLKAPYMEVDVVRGSFLCFRASILKEIGGFDEGTFLYYEENIICKKIKRAGYKVGIIPTCSYIHNHKISKGTIYHDRHVALKSCYYYLEHYTEASSLQLRLFVLASHYCNFEQSVINTIKRFMHNR